MGASRDSWRPTAREELLLRWYMEKNLRAVIERGDRKLFNRFFDSQKRIRKYFRWGFRDQTDEQRLEELAQALDKIHQRLAFDDFPAGDGSLRGSTGNHNAGRSRESAPEWDPYLEGYGY